MTNLRFSPTARSVWARTSPIRAVCACRARPIAIRSKARRTPAPIDGFTPEQRFYLGYATLWAQNIRDEEIARLTKLDVHSLGKWRVNATLRNLQDFYDAFSITDGPMFLPEQDRVIIW